MTEEELRAGAVQRQKDSRPVFPNHGFATVLYAKPRKAEVDALLERCGAVIDGSYVRADLWTGRIYSEKIVLQQSGFREVADALYEDFMTWCLACMDRSTSTDATVLLASLRELQGRGVEVQVRGERWQARVLEDESLIAFDGASLQISGGKASEIARARTWIADVTWDSAAAFVSLSGERAYDELANGVDIPSLRKLAPAVLEALLSATESVKLAFGQGTDPWNAAIQKGLECADDGVILTEKRSGILSAATRLGITCHDISNDRRSALAKAVGAHALRLARLT